MVAIAQQAEHQIVDLGVAGSNPASHPLIPDSFGAGRVSHRGGRLDRGEPLEDLGQFASLANQSHNQVIGVMKLIPVTLSSEGSYPMAEAL